MSVIKPPLATVILQICRPREQRLVEGRLPRNACTENSRDSWRVCWVGLGRPPIPPEVLARSTFKVNRYVRLVSAQNNAGQRVRRKKSAVKSIGCRQQVGHCWAIAHITAASGRSAVQMTIDVEDRVGKSMR